ncbi:hypothetical protein [Microbacterium xanthum]|uniref:hypothetical protein n=1 Tax=Microbacterium xanthum TaxID=3079794 RepID=UPI002AD4EDD0|nr:MULTISPECIES: hypothetical protein [unclassified Microbacterium]MDZ8172144.1 hypothetical protein [Microbacterium sp. KSW-48]MDZ8202149.1 hypothetical protein [Microbacterium sp. SSW1-59]
MVERVTAGAASTTIRPAVRVALVYLLARLVTTGFFLSASAIAPADARHGRDATLGTYVLAWDAQWYWLIAFQGYPVDLPLTEAGQVAENAWAFMPLYPVLSAVVSLPFGHWGVGAFLVTLAAGYGCALVLHGMFRERLGEGAALWGVVFFSAGPLAALLQVGYAEALFLFFLLLAIRCVQTRRYGWLYALIPLMGYTRPGVLAFGLFLALFGLWRLTRREVEPVTRHDVIHILSLGALATVVGFSWQVIAAVVTGDPAAYLDTELAWRRLWVGDSGGFVPFEGWVQGAAFWFPRWGLPAWTGVIALLGIVAAVAALLLFEPHVKRLGVEVRLWSASYLVYLLAVFFPQSSTFRLLFPLSPLAGALAVPASRRWRIGVLVACLIGQWLWVYNMYTLGNTFWRIP